MARRVFVQLVHPGKDTEDARRRVSLSGLGDAALPIVQELANARLVVTGKLDPGTVEPTDGPLNESDRSHAPESGETVEVAHEALIRNWNTLREWMKEDRAFRLWQEDFQTPFRRWGRNKRDEGALLRGGQLAEAERWRGERADALTVEEVEFIDEGVRLQRRTQRRRKLTTVASLFIAAIMAGMGAYAWYASTEAERNAVLAKREAERATAEAQRAEKALRVSQAEYLVRQGQDLFDAHPVLGIRLALEGLKHATYGRETPPASIAEAAVRMAERGHLFKLGGDIDNIYPSPLNTRFIVDHRYTPDELRRSADGELLATLAGNIREVTFSPDAENSVFVADYTDAPDELRRSADGDVLATLPSDISEVTFSPDAENSVFVAEYTKAPDELRRTADGELLATLASERRTTTVDFGKVTFSPDAENSVFITNYTDVPDELRRSADGELLATLADTIRGATFSPDAENSVFVAEYTKAPGELRRSADGEVLAPAELRRSADGELLAPLGGFFKSFQRVTFSPDAEQSVFVAEYTNVPGELRRSADGEVLATLAGNIRWVDFSPDAESSVFVAEYTDASDELRRSADGEVLATLAGNLGDVTFSRDAENSVFVATYTDAPGELRRSADGELLATLTGNLGGVTFSPAAENSVFVVEYTDAPGELRRSANGEVLATVADTINKDEWLWPRERAHTAGVTFSPDAAGAVFLVSYRGAPDELRRSADGEVLATLAGNLGGAIFSPDTEGAVLVVNYGDRLAELRRSADGEVLATLAGTISPITIKPFLLGNLFSERAQAQGVTFSPGTQRAVFVVDYVNGPSELWLNSDSPRRIRQIEIGSAGYLFDREARRMLVWYGDGRAYYLDIEWLKAVTDPKGVSMDELTDLACEQLFTTKWFDEAALAKYLDGRPSQVCQGK